MRGDEPEIVVRTGGHPLLHMLASFPIACFTGALATDVAYALTADMMWADFSAWLLAAGLIMGLLAALAGLAHLAAHRFRRARRPAWEAAVGSLLVLLLAFVNNLVHSRDAWTSVVPFGLALSAATVVVMLATAWLAFGGATRRTLDARYAGARA